ncbi:MAG: hypothetical protein ACE5IL_16380 [Myxococcota bacterium]
MSLVLGPLAVTSRARAIEIALPGEARMEVHGFYEFRMRGLFRNNPFTSRSATLSQFRHVLDLETEIELFPEGIGPFEELSAYTRWLISYDCVYQRACGVFPAADSFGARAKRVPAYLRHARLVSPQIGGVMPQALRPGTLLDPRKDRFNANGRLRDCTNPDGVFLSPWPFGGLCNVNNRSRLDEPILPLGFNNALGVQRKFLNTRAGSLNAFFSEFSVRAALPQLEKVGIDFPSFLKAPALGPEDTALARAFEAEAARERSGGASATGVEALQNAARALLAGTRQEGIRRILDVRPDPSRFHQLARLQAPDLLSAVYGVAGFKDVNIAFTPDLSQVVRPGGYFRRPAADTLSEVAIGLTQNSQPITEIRFADGRILSGSAFQTSLKQSSGTSFFETAATVATFFGPDGISRTADDLPTSDPDLPAGFVHLRAPVRLVDSGFAARRLESGALDDPNRNLVAAEGQVVEIYRVLAQGISQRECTSQKFPAGLQSNGSIALIAGDGVNANGECVVLASSRNDQVGSLLDGSGQHPFVTLEALAALRDPAHRPASAVSEPTDLTDLVGRSAAGGRGLPARPQNPDGGLFFRSAGLQRLILDHDHLVSNLDLDFTEEELRWDHGASQDENEFREGYLEGELLDSQVYFRVGKLLLVWGKTELFRNQDRLNPLDIGIGTLARLEESRIGQWAATVSLSPTAWMQVGPAHDLRLELAVIFDDFEPTDFGECGEGLSFVQVCGLLLGAQAHGLLGLGLAGEVRPSDRPQLLQRFDYGLRLEGRFDRFTFALTDFWGWDDSPIADVVQQYARRVDPVTGAPVTGSGSEACRVRVDGAGRPVGPDGVRVESPTTDRERNLNLDNGFPSEGNCLLWKVDPADPQGPRRVRTQREVALGLSVNQTLFHTLCTLTFDEDTGRCALDLTNDVAIGVSVADVLGGDGGGDGVAARGFDSIRLKLPGESLPRPLDSSLDLADPAVLAGVEAQLESLDAKKRFISSSLGVATQTGGTSAASGSQLSQLTSPEKALLGCGPAFLSPCGLNDVASLRDSELLSRELGRKADTSAEIFGGIDLLNARGDVLFQEFAPLQVSAAGAPVGIRSGGTNLEPTNGLHYEAGVSTTAHPVRPSASPDVVATDFFVEPFKWEADPELLARGVIVFQVDPNDPEGLQPGTRTRLAEGGENCTPRFGGPDPGCTALEILSANFQRLAITNEIIGTDDVFDPAETVTELLNMLDGDVSTDFRGDPIAGDDGIVFANFIVDPARSDRGLYGYRSDAPPGPIDLDLERYQRAIVVTGNQRPGLVADRFEDCAPSRFKGSGLCHLWLAESPDGSKLIVGALPIGLLATELVPRAGGKLRVDPNTGQAVPDATSGSQDAVDLVIPLQSLSPLELQQVANRQNTRTVIDLRFRDQNGEERVHRVVLCRRVGVLLPNRPCGTKPLAGLDPIDVDHDGVPDLDENGDQQLDFVDDGLPGPVSDDNPLCGSGIPGDPLQEALQAELSGAEQEVLKKVLPQGLPPRSPVFCAGVVGLLATTGQTLPSLRAGGNGRFGRRSFIWQGGQELALDFQRRNVLGFSVDFNHDPSKTSWGIEFSWTANKLFSNTNEPDGLNSLDDFALTISVDRPSFFHFLNPNRSFFINFQFFLRYLAGFEGGRRDHDGNFGVASYPLSGLATLSIFTGYFQDRLQPRVTFVWDPTTSSGAALSGLSYTYNPDFSIGVALNHFFGHPQQIQSPDFPAALRGSADTTSEAFRGLSAVRDRDAALLVLRRSF